ncbi:MAG: hypothetical protein AAF744_03945 [Pseudomonadota bacterium]
MTHLRHAFALALCGVLTAPAARAETLTLDFLPPEMTPRDICFSAPRAAQPDDLEVEGSHTELTDEDRIRYLRRDITRYTAEDADGFFDFIDALILRRGSIDPAFTKVDQTLARIDLMLRAGRLEGLREAGLIEGLRAQVGEMTNNQRVTLARFYAEGLGVAQDAAFAQELIREAAYGGNARALLEIARLAQAGSLVEGWDAPLDLTVTMAFGGILGALDSGVCGRAEQIAQAYVTGDVVTANPALALAWFRFAADMGRAESAWRVVEHYLNADAAQKDNAALRHYLEQAVRLGISVDDRAQAALVAFGAIDADDMAALLGFNHAQDARRTRAAVAPHLQLRVKIDGEEVGETSEYELYLREIAQMPEAPGRVFERLAGDVLVHRGRWSGEAEAMALLEIGAQRGDARATQRLAHMLMRYRDDPAQVARAESLLMEVVARHGKAEAMRDLDRLYRCQVNDAPRLVQAEKWLESYRASGHRSVRVDPTDMLALAPTRSPEAIARIQSLALARRATMAAMQAQRVQADALASDGALRFWAAEVNRTARGLEDFARLEFELATTPAERDIALELFRRVHLHNGVTSALDLSVALTAYDARAPQIAEEIARLLTQAGKRGEGNSIRLLARLQTRTRPEAEVYAEFADVIEERGDFLALMFAIPHIGPDKLDDYIDRAVSLMSCGTKDAEELADAYALHGQGALSFHWQQIGLTFEGGHVLSKLRLSDRQMGLYARGAAPDALTLAKRAAGDGDANAPMRMIALTANPGLETYDPTAAVEHMKAALDRGAGAELAQIAALYRAAPGALRDALDAVVDITGALEQAANAGDVAATYQLGALLRDRARNVQTLGRAVDWVERAAARGDRTAMFELGQAYGMGLGRIVDYSLSVHWLDQAEAAGHPEAAALARLMRLKGGL